MPVKTSDELNGHLKNTKKSYSYNLLIIGLCTGGAWDFTLTTPQPYLTK
jgi:hypothetical protein